MADLAKGYTFGATEQVTAAKLHALVDEASITNIVNADVSASAAISSTKLDLTAAGYMTSGGNFTITGTHTFSTAPVLPSSMKSGLDATLVTGTKGTANHIPKWDANGDIIEGYALIDDDTMATASASNVASAESIKAYVDSEISGIAVGEVFAAADTIIARNDGVDTANGALAKKKEFLISNEGVLRISFTISIGGSNGETGNARIYRNGSAVGTARSVTAASSPATFTEDISGWSVGDKVQIYLGTTVGGLNVSLTNFHLKSSTYGIPLRLLTGTTATTDRGYVNNT